MQCPIRKSFTTGLREAHPLQAMFSVYSTQLKYGGEFTQPSLSASSAAFLTFAAEPGDVDGRLGIAPAALAVVRVLQAKK